MDNLADLLAKRLPEEPPEIKAIKAYVQQHFREAVGVMVRERDVVITVRSSAVAAPCVCALLICHGYCNSHSGGWSSGSARSAASRPTVQPGYSL
jgi:hypothetical protein